MPAWEEAYDRDERIADVAWILHCKFAL